MVKNEIKVYVPIVWVEVLRSFLDEQNKTVYNNEYLLWDGELMDFAEKRATKTDIFFPRYDKFVPTRKIGEFGLQGKPKHVEKEVVEVKPFIRTPISRFNIYLIGTKTRISRIVTGSFTGLIDNKNKNENLHRQGTKPNSNK